MLAVILSILKIIGIVLLALIGVVLALILLILFWPFSYKLYGDNLTNMNGGAKVSWLLHFISVKAYYNENFNIEVRILGLKIFDKLKKDSKLITESKKKSAEIDESNNIKSDDIDSGNIDSGNIDSDNIDSDNIDSMISDDFAWDDMDSEPSSNKKKSDKSTSNIKKKFISKKKISFFEWIGDLFDKAWDFIEDLPWKIVEFAEKPGERIDKIVDSICYYDRILSSNGTEWVVQYIKKKILAILKALKPSSSRINIDYSSTDPEKAAKAFEVFVMTKPIHPKNTNMNVRFDQDEMKFYVKVKGNFILAPIAYNALTLIFNKKVKKFIKLMKREDS